MNWTRRLCFACGQLGMMALARYFFSWIIAFANARDPAAGPGAGEFLFSAALVGVALFGFRIFDGVTDPLAGMLSDGWVRRGGERRTLLLWSFLLPPLGLALCFLPTHAMGESLRWALLLAGMFLFFTGYTIYAIPYWSLIDDYAGEDGDERRTLSTLLGVGLLLATAVVAIGSPFLIGKAGAYGLGALGVAVPATLLMVLPWFAQPARVGAAPVAGPSKHAPPLEVIKDALRHRRFLAVLAIFSGSQMSFTVVTSAAPFIASHLLGGSDADVPRIMAPFLGTAIPFFAVAPAISRWLGWQRAIMLASVLLGVVYAGTAGLGRPLIGDAWTTAMLLFGLAGPMAAVLLGLEGEAIAACCRERPGATISIYFGLFNFAVKCLNGVAIALSGWLVEQSRGEWGVGAIRAMGLVAGGLLVLGGLGYFALAPREVAAPPTQPAA